MKNTMRKKGVRWWNVLIIKEKVFSHIHAKTIDIGRIDKKCIARIGDCT